MITTVEIKTEPSKCLVEEDVGTRLHAKSELLQITRQDSSDAIVVTIHEIEFDGQQEPERTQTVIVNDYNVDFLKAALLMPRNASYLYDYATSGAEIIYAYDVILTRKGKMIYEKLLRGKVRRTYSSCQNPRIRNVFGGVEAANFWPNAAVQARCTGGGQPVEVSDLRDEVMNRIADAIAEAPPIQEAIERGE